MKTWNAPTLQELNVSLTAACGGGPEPSYDVEPITDYPVDGDAGTKGGMSS